MNYIAVVNTIKRDQNLVERCIKGLLAQKIKPLKVYLIDQNVTELTLSKEILSNPLFERVKVNYKSVSGKQFNSISRWQQIGYFFVMTTVIQVKIILRY